MFYIEDLDINTKADDQIPNDMTFNKMISSSKITLNFFLINSKH